MAFPVTKLTSGLSARLRLEISRKFFGKEVQQANGSSLRTYFEYYSEELELLQFGASSLAWQSAELAATTHEDVLYIVNILDDLKVADKSHIRSKLRVRFTTSSDLGIDRALDLAVRLWLMLNVRESQYYSLRHPTPCLQWEDKKSLQTCMLDWFPRSRWKLNSRESRIDPYFTAANMVEICGLQIYWTTSLQEHLRLDRRQKTLQIFPYRDVLQAFLTKNRRSSGING